MDIKTTAITAAKKAGEVLLELSKKEIQYEMKNKHDIVAEADLKSEQIILDTISQNFPEHSIFAEEKGEVIKDSEYTWIVDPLDGTINFSRGLDEYCISIAVEKNNETILGLIYQPHLNKTYLAEKGKGAFLNEKKLHVSNESEMINMMLYMGSTSNIKYRIKSFQVLSKVCGQVRNIRMFGSGSLELSKIAAGQLDIYFKLLRAHYWDYAPGILLVEEAGGMATDLAGDKFTKHSNFCVVSNGKKHQELLDILNKELNEVQNLWK